eukprot:12424742-Karenia_brevis.AAC.1
MQQSSLRFRLVSARVAKEEDFKRASKEIQEYMQVLQDSMDLRQRQLEQLTQAWQEEDQNLAK